jgi:hypothetical protein
MILSAFRLPLGRRELAAALTGLSLMACARPGSLSYHPEPTGRISFTNATQDRVAVYLAIGDARPWRLGSVEPFRTASLPLPRFGDGGTVATARLLVRSLGLSHSGRATGADLDVSALRTPSDTREFLTTMRWTFVGHQLFSETPLPRKRPPSAPGPSAG